MKTLEMQRPFAGNVADSEGIHQIIVLHLPMASNLCKEAVTLL